MKLLTEQYWGEFKPDGRLFERLIAKLLEFQYQGKTFHITKASHDGAHDLESIIPLIENVNVDIWAECKYRKNTLPIHQVAMTLVMAYLEKVKLILFFSYSPVNREFISYISRFIEKSGIECKIFDDCDLETLILRHRDKPEIQQFFPDFFKGNSSDINNVQIQTHLTVSYDVLQNGTKIPCRTTDEQKLPYISITDSVSIWLILRNHSNTEVLSVNIRLPDICNSNDFICLTSTDSKAQFCWKLALKPNEILGFRLDFRIKHFSGILKLPTVSIDCGQKKPKMIHAGRVRGRWLAEAPLIGQAFYAALNAQHMAMQAPSILTAQVLGRSGTGKSRLLREICLQASALNKKTFLWDTDTQKGDHISLMRAMISALEGLPLIKKPNEQIIFTDQDMAARRLRAAQFIYQEKALENCGPQQLAEYFIDLMNEKSVWIILDNVQNCDEKTLDMLELMIKYAQVHHHNSGILLSFNMDFLFKGTKASKLSQFISSQSAQHPSQCQTYVIQDFDQEEALDYLRACLNCSKPNQQIPSDDELLYQQTLSVLINHYGKRPFYLQNILLYLEQRGILARTEDSTFYITDISAFWNNVRELPPTLEALLAARTENVLSYLPDNQQREQCTYLFSLLTISESIPSDLWRKLFQNFSAKDYLLQAGIITQLTDGSITLYHQYFGQYFHKAYPFHALSTNQLEQFVNAVKKIRAISDLIVPVALAQYYLGDVDEIYYQKLMKKVMNWQIDARISQYVLPIVATLLDRRKDDMQVFNYVKCYNAICFMTANREGIEKACTFYERLLTGFEEEPQRYHDAFDQLFVLLREYAISLNNLNKNDTGLKTLNRIQAGLDELPFTDTRKQKYVAEIFHIKCMMHYWCGETKLAITDAENAIKSAEKGNALWQKLSALREYGYTYYYAQNAAEQREHMCARWDQAMDLYSALQPDGATGLHGSELQPYIASHLVSAIADLARSDMVSAEQKVDMLTKYLDKTDMPFYDIKIRLLRAQFLLMQEFNLNHIVNDTEEIHLLIGQATDKCAIYYNLQDYPNCFYMEAVTFLLSGEHKKALDGYLKTCHVLQKQVDMYSEAASIEKVWRYFYEDMAMQLRKMNVAFPEKLLRNIHSREIQSVVRHIMHTNQFDFDCLWDERVASTAVTDHTGQWVFPKI